MREKAIWSLPTVFVQNPYGATHVWLTSRWIMFDLWSAYWINRFLAELRLSFVWYWCAISVFYRRRNRILLPLFCGVLRRSASTGFDGAISRRVVCDYVLAGDMNSAYVYACACRHGEDTANILRWHIDHKTYVLRYLNERIKTATSEAQW